MSDQIELRRYEKQVKNGWYHSRTVFRVTGDEVLYRFETESDGYQVGCSTVKAFRRWMRGCLAGREVPNE